MQPMRLDDFLSDVQDTAIKTGIRLDDFLSGSMPAAAKTAGQAMGLPMAQSLSDYSTKPEVQRKVNPVDEYLAKQDKNK